MKIKHKQSNFEWTVRIRLKYEGEPVYGGGISYLLLKTDELKSLHAAAKDMGMSYRKALQIVKRAEKHLKNPLIIKEIGGIGGGGSTLTAFGKVFVSRFHDLEKEVNIYTSYLIENSFKDIDF